MLKDHSSSAIVAITDYARAKAFYHDTLGLTLIDEGEGDMQGTMDFQTGDTRLTVYQSEFAGSNKANAVTWAMNGDLVEVVRALKAKGVAFEHYPDMGMTLNDDIHEFGAAKLVWFKDPDGNILHLTEGMR